MMLGVTDQPRFDAREVPSPELVAARLRLGTLDIERVPMWAAYWLVDGYDGAALAELAGLRSSDAREARDLLPTALAECGCTVPPSRLAAAMTMFADLARLQQSGRAGERWVAAKVEEVLSVNNYDDEIARLPLGRIYHLSAEWPEHPGRSWGRSSEELAGLVAAACAAQLEMSTSSPERPILATTLWRPIGEQELALVAASGWTAWPPRLADQPIFYPVLNREYAVQIARDWNVLHSGVGYVTEFEVRTDFLDRYDVQQVGGRTILEYWIPAADLEQLNASIVGLIRVVDRFAHRLAEGS